MLITTSADGAGALGRPVPEGHLVTRGVDAASDRRAHLAGAEQRDTHRGYPTATSGWLGFTTSPSLT